MKTEGAYNEGLHAARCPNGHTAWSGDWRHHAPLVEWKACPICRRRFTKLKCPARCRAAALAELFARCKRLEKALREIAGFKDKWIDKAPATMADAMRANARRALAGEK